MIYQNLVQLVGNTGSLFEGLYLKLDYNPTGSVKDRPMLYMIKDLEERELFRAIHWWKPPAEIWNSHGILGECTRL